MKAVAAPEKGGPRVNRDIRAVQVQLIDADGQNRGVVNLADAQKLAEEAALDLVEIVPNATPPVCKILDFGKYRFLEQKKSSEARKRQKVVEIKEIKLRPGIDDHDYEVKMRSVRRFFDEGDKVKVTLRFRGREMAHQDIGLQAAAAGQSRDCADRQGRGRTSDGRPADDHGSGAEVETSGRAAADERSAAESQARRSGRIRYSRPLFAAGVVCAVGPFRPLRGKGRIVTTAPVYADPAADRRAAETASVGVIAALSASHMLNDTMQSLAPALYPVFARELSLSFFQIGVITFVFQLTASLLQPLIGFALDRRPLNAILPVGMAFTVVGLLLLAFAGTYPLILLSVAVIGIGSAVFHPEASRVARAASGGPARLRPEPLSGRREFRPVDGAAARGLHRRAVRPAFGARLHRSCADRRRYPDRREPLVCGPSRRAPNTPPPRSRVPPIRAQSSFARLRC